MWQSWASCSNKILLTSSLPCSPEQSQSFPGGIHRHPGRRRLGSSPLLSPLLDGHLNLGSLASKVYSIWNAETFFSQAQCSALHWDGGNSRRETGVIDESVQPGSRFTSTPLIPWPFGTSSTSRDQNPVGKLAVTVTSSRVLVEACWAFSWAQENV